MQKNTVFSKIALLVGLSIILSCYLASCTGNTPANAEEVRIVVVSIDGMADWLLDELIERDMVPNIARILENGFAADHAITTLPAKTAVGHASIWTGTDPSYTAIHSNDIIRTPFSEHTIVDRFSGFSSSGLRAEPIWISAARQGKKVVVAEATQVYPFQNVTDNCLIIDGYGNAILSPEVLTARNCDLRKATDWKNIPLDGKLCLTFSRNWHDSTIHFLLFDDPDDETIGFDTVWLSSSKDGDKRITELKPLPPVTGTGANFSDPVGIDKQGETGFAYFRLFDLAEDGSSFTLYRSKVHILQSTDSEIQAQLLNDKVGFVGNPAYSEYRKGELGLQIPLGGDGFAELCFLETIQHSTEKFLDIALPQLKRADFDLYITYLPYPDGFFHTWLGLVATIDGKLLSAEESPVFNYFAEAVSIVDRYVGEIYDNLPENTVMFIVSDHGFRAVNRKLFPNNALKKAGLLVLNEDGSVDLSKTKAVFYPGYGGFVVVNSEKFKNGIVPTEQVESVIDEIVEIYENLVDENGNRIIDHIIIPGRDGELGMTGPFKGDIYLHPVDGYNAIGDINSDIDFVDMEYPSGEHNGDPRDRQMNSIFLVSSRNKLKKIDLEQMRAIDIAPTISRILGIDPPANATGNVVTEILESVSSDGEN